MKRLLRKFETARAQVPGPVAEIEEGAEIGLIAFGTTHWAVVESRDQLRQESDQKTSYLRIRALPLGQEAGRLCRKSRARLRRGAETVTPRCASFCAASWPIAPSSSRSSGAFFTSTDIRSMPAAWTDSILEQESLR